MKTFYQLGLFLFLFLCLISESISQTKKHFELVEGTYFLSDEISPNQAKGLAIEEAKKNALRKAGVIENISENSILWQSQDLNSVKSNFSSFSTIELQGAISNYTVDTIIQLENELGKIQYKAIINADVILYRTKSDPTFDFNLNGISDIYKSTELVSFSIETSTDGFLHIFQFEDKTASLIFPNRYETSNQLLSKKIIKFPTNPAIVYSLDSSQKGKIVTLIFVYTKINVAFKGKETAEDIWRWVYGISPDARRVKIQELLVR
jgi:hypothetical protein